MPVSWIHARFESGVYEVACAKNSREPSSKIGQMWLFCLWFLLFGWATGQSGFELNEAHKGFKNEFSLLGDKATTRLVNGDMERTIQLGSPSDLSLEFLTNSLNLTTEDLELSYETIWYFNHKEMRTVTIKRARGQGEKTADAVNIHQQTKEQRPTGRWIQDGSGTKRSLRAKRVIFGVDERKKLPPSSKAQKVPHSAACKVSCKGFCSWSCSGILIGSRHVLTSAHCLDGVTSRTVQVGFLERNGRLHWYDAMKAFIPLEWKISKALAGDYAVLKLKRSPNRSYVSVSSVALPKNSVISITGFPGDKDPSSLWTTKCRALGVTSGLIWNQCDAARGSSGSGVFVKDNNGGLPRTKVVGVLSGEKVIRSRNRGQRVRLNVAVHLTGPKVSQIQEWTRD